MWGRWREGEKDGKRKRDRGLVKREEERREGEPYIEGGTGGERGADGERGRGSEGMR